jgi:hypothetical protein
VASAPLSHRETREEIKLDPKSSSLSGVEGSGARGVQYIGYVEVDVVSWISLYMDDWLRLMLASAPLSQQETDKFKRESIPESSSLSGAETSDKVVKMCRKYWNEFWPNWGCCFKDRFMESNT